MKTRMLLGFFLFGSRSDSARAWLPCLLLAFSLAARADRADDYLTSEMSGRRIAGAALAVIQNGQVVKTAFYGVANLEWNVPVRAETAFEIGSITKQFTSAAILLLAQEGKLSVDDPVSRYLKPLPEAWTNVTIRHLLTHTSGIKSYTGLDGFELRRHLTREQFLRAIGAQPMEFAPGAAWKYCNTGYSLLGYIIEEASGTNYWDFMRQRIFGPLGMNHTTDRLPSAIIPFRASGYEQTNGVRFNRDYDLTDVFAAGALVSTLGDLAKWTLALDQDRLLDGETKRQMWTPVRFNNGGSTNYGFGWNFAVVDGHRVIGHGGSTSGFSATHQRFPDDHLAVILLMNTGEDIASVLARKIATFYFGRAEGSGGGEPGRSGPRR